jgi:hypothetical protein
MDRDYAPGRTGFRLIDLVILIVIALMLIGLVACYLIKLNSAEKRELFRALTFHNEELEQRLRQTEYFFDIGPIGQGMPVDVPRSLKLWRRASLDRSFGEVKQALGEHHPFVPASYLDGRTRFDLPRR